MKVINIESLKGTPREVFCPKGGFISTRFILESDKMGYSVTRTIIPVGEPQFWHYTKHLETCFCIQGHGILTNTITGEKFEIRPNIAYVLDKNDPHTFQALTEVVLVCVFNPPLKGAELHKVDGSY